MAQELILAVIVSFDTFLASAAYRAGKIRIPVLSAVVICFLSSLFLAVSLLFSDFLSRIIPIGVCEIAGFIILTSIGIITMLKSFFRALVRQLSQRGELSLRPKSSGIVIKLYLDDTAADFDCSKTLSAREAAALALAGSLDSVATGLSCGYNEINPAISAVFAFIAGFAAIILGGIAGKRAAGMNHDFSWLGGAALIAFAVYEFIK
ncbi:MAG: manganese efflux pump [Ruminococcus sp.]|nr:manganese efflux pump [Ruminococcus sp.]